MQMLNRYFTPFALILIVSAIWFGEADPQAVKFSIAILILSIAVNWWLSKNAYRFSHWTRQMKAAQVWINYIWAVPLFYLLAPFWGPMWLLFVMAPATAALVMSWWQTLLVALVSSLTMLAIYYHHGVFQAAASGGMAVVHASFIVILALFMHALAQSALRLRDASMRP